MPRVKPVEMTYLSTLDSEKIERDYFESMMQAGRETGIFQSSISNMAQCKNIFRTRLDEEWVTFDYELQEHRDEVGEEKIQEKHKMLYEKILKESEKEENLQPA